MFLELIIIFTTIYQTKNFTWHKNYQRMDLQKIDILQKIQNLPYGNVLFAFEGYKPNDRKTTYNWIGAVGHKRNIFNDLEQAEVLGIDYKDRFKIVSNFSKNVCSDRNLYSALKKQAQVDYIVFKKDSEVLRCLNFFKLDKFDVIFSNSKYAVAKQV